MRGMYGRGRFFRGRGQFGARGGPGGRWNPNLNMKSAGSLQVLSKAQKNKERYVPSMSGELSKNPENLSI